MHAGSGAAAGLEKEGEEGGLVGGEHSVVVARVGDRHHHRGGGGQDRKVVEPDGSGSAGVGEGGEQAAAATGCGAALGLDEVALGALSVLNDHVGPWARVHRGGDGGRVVDAESRHIVEDGQGEGD